jgi:hydrogenase maturation factor HypF (carbamoyltransferase family)
MQDEEPGDLATVLAMTQNELDQAHEIFMITVDQQLTPEEMLVWRPEELGVPETDLDRRFRFGQYSLSGNTWKARMILAICPHFLKKGDMWNGFKTCKK